MIKQLGLLPLAPLRFTLWVAEKVAEEADQQQNSPQGRLRQLREIEDARLRGEIDDDQAAELEAQVIARASGASRYG
jgi:hypothetical protein